MFITNSPLLFYDRIKGRNYHIWVQVYVVTFEYPPKVKKEREGVTGEQ